MIKMRENYLMNQGVMLQWGDCEECNKVADYSSEDTLLKLDNSSDVVSTWDCDYCNENFCGECGSEYSNDDFNYLCDECNEVLILEYEELVDELENEEE